MTTTLPAQDGLIDPSRTRTARDGTRFNHHADRPRGRLENLAPNWFTSVMGTGIVATAAATLPIQFPGLRSAATVMWALASLLLASLAAASALQWLRCRPVAVAHHSNPVLGHFYGALPMAVLTVGAGTLLLGRDVLGVRVAVTVDLVLWALGTVLGLLCAIVLPYLLFTRHAVRPDGAFGGWLMPVVPPMVSASAGALLLPYVPAGNARLTLLMGCYAMFGLSLLCSLIIITLIWSRLAHHKVGAATAVPTLWIVVGPLGQSITAANLLGTQAHTATTEPLATALQLFGLLFGIPALGFAFLWLALAASITLHTLKLGLPFSLTWWSFTFPVGTCVTAMNSLSTQIHLPALTALAGLGFVFLAAAWLLVSIRTVCGLINGSLFHIPPIASDPATSTTTQGPDRS